MHLTIHKLKTDEIMHKVVSQHRVCQRRGCCSSLSCTIKLHDSLQG